METSPVSDGDDVAGGSSVDDDYSTKKYTEILGFYDGGVPRTLYQIWNTAIQCAIAKFSIYGPGVTGRDRFAWCCEWAVAHPAMQRAATLAARPDATPIRERAAARPFAVPVIIPPPVLGRCSRKQPLTPKEAPPAAPPAPSPAPTPPPLLGLKKGPAWLPQSLLLLHHTSLPRSDPPGLPRRVPLPP